MNIINAASPKATYGSNISSLLTGTMLPPTLDDG
jgi:hypothetical protein